jgi:hypothetical protein
MLKRSMLSRLRFFYDCTASPAPAGPVGASDANLGIKDIVKCAREFGVRARERAIDWARLQGAQLVIKSLAGAVVAMRPPDADLATQVHKPIAADTTLIVVGSVAASGTSRATSACTNLHDVPWL